MSLAAELEQLARLFQAGALTQEEFAQAKASTLARMNAAVPASVPPGLLSHGEVTVASHESATQPQRETPHFFFAPSHCGENDTAFRRLHTILSNILRFPSEKRFRVLRLENETLRRQLFSVRPDATFSTVSHPPHAVADGNGGGSMLRNENADEEDRSVTSAPYLDDEFVSAAELFLTSHGFRRMWQRRGRGGADVGSELLPCTRDHPPPTDAELVLEFFLEPPLSPASPSFQTLREGLEELAHMQQRDADAKRRAAEVQALRKSVVTDIRMQRLHDAEERGEVEAHCQGLFLQEARLADDDYCTTLECVATIRQILTNIARAPDDPKFRVLRVGNPRVHRVLVHQKGGLEFLIGVAKFEFAADDGELRLTGSATDAAQRASSALGALDRMEAALLQARAESRSADRDAAITAARAELARELEVTRRQRAPQPAVADGFEAAASGGRRVTMEEALTHILGRDADE